MEILGSFELNTCEYLVQLEKGCVSPSLRTKVRNAALENVNSARGIFDALLEHHTSFKTKELFLENFKVLGLENLCSLKAAEIIYSISLYGNKATTLLNNEKMELVKALDRASSGCKDSKLAAGLLSTALSAMLWLDLVIFDAGYTKDLIARVKAAESGWAPRALVLAMR